MRRATLLLPLLMLLLLTGLAFKGRLISIPQVRDEATAGMFDTRRAIGRLERILGDQRPHSVDSAANDTVRARIIAELRALGINPRITDNLACNGAAEARAIGCARVRNIVASLGPPEPGPLLLVSHYDSTPVGPGAADDGIGISVMIEIAAQLAGRDLKRPVSFLFNEGEESGLIGARAFLDRDPLARRVDALVNIEARGTEGPAIMFETSRPNAAAIDWYGPTVARPVANSLSTDFYKLIPNSTDVRVFEGRPWTILNFAIIGNETRYHSPSDNLAALSPRSVQHMGDQVLALAADYADGRTQTRADGSRAFADLFGRRLVVLPLALSLVGLGLLVAALLLLSWKRRAGLGRALAAQALGLIGAAVLAFAGQVAVGALRPGEYWRAHPDAISAAILLCANSACLAAVLWAARKVDAPKHRLGFWLVFVLIGAGISVAAPGASIFFLIPPLIACASLATRGRLAQVLAVLAALVLLVLWAPLTALVEILLDYDDAWVFAPFFAVMLLPFLIELRGILREARPVPALAVAAALAIGGWIAVAALPAYSVNRKQAFGLEYAIEANGKARWLVVNDGAPLPEGFARVGRFAGGVTVPWSTRKRWAAPAPPGLARTPGVAVLGGRDVEGGRIVSVRLEANGSEAITLFAPPSAGVRAVQAGDWRQKMGGKDDPAADRAAKGVDRHFSVRCQGRSCEGMRIDILLATPAPVDWTVIGSRTGLPRDGRTLLQARPANAAPQYTADATIGVAKLRF